jgi:hypothetical protein
MSLLHRVELVYDMTGDSVKPVSDGSVPAGKGLGFDCRYRRLHLVGGLLSDLLAYPLVPFAAILEKATKSLDGVPLLPLLLFFTGPVTGGVVGSGMRPVAVGHGLDQSRALALASSSNCDPRRQVHRDRIHAVDPEPIEAVGRRLLSDRLGGGLLFIRNRDRIEVVCADEHGRGLPDACEIHPGVEVALRSRPVAEVDGGDGVCTTQLGDI